MTRLSIDIPNELHHYLKIHTARKKVTVVDFVRDAIYKKIDQEKIPNRETIKAIEESRKGIGITCFSSKEDFLKHLSQLEKEVEQELAERN